MTSHSTNEIDDNESPPIHPTLRIVEKYVSRLWYYSDDTSLNLGTATQTELNDRVICLLNTNLKDEVSHNTLRRRVCGDFEMWDKAIWDRVHKEVRMKLFNVLRDNGVRVPRHVKVSDRLASLVRTDNRVLVDENHIEGEDDTADPSEEDYAANLPELASADRSDVGPLLDKTSSDSNKKEEKLPEEPASARPECVRFEEKQTSVPSQEKPTADLDDKPCLSLSMGKCTNLRKNNDLDEERHEEKRLAEPPDRQTDTRSTAAPVSKDSAADKVGADPVQRRSKDLKRGCPTEDALDKDSVVDRVLVVPPDPPDLQRRRPSEEERSAKPPDKKKSSGDSLLAYPTTSNDPAVGIIFNDPPNFVDKSPTTFRHRDPAQTPTDSSDGTGNQEQEIKEEKTLRGDCNFVCHRSLPSTGMTWTDRAERLTPPFLLTRALWSHFLRYSWNNYRLVERLVP
ncbi:hypothetical protein E4U35_005482 [Claviceps purpurea]|nr:hypothetical protein E4U35_005482 [Claviceps purpurea]